MAGFQETFSDPHHVFGVLRRQRDVWTQACVYKNQAVCFVIQRAGVHKVQMALGHLLLCPCDDFVFA